MNKLIFDTDPGIDDVIALLVAKRLDLDVRLIVSTYGNVSHEHTDRNARDINTILKSGCPVLYGADNPISGSPFTAEYVHGYNGLGNINLDIVSEPSVKVDDYVEHYYQMIVANAPVDIITLGPLTNLASVIIRHPDATQYISSLCVMGYGLNVFNVNNISEFNVICDPLAADIIANANLPTTVVPLDVTHKAQLSIEEVEEIKGYLNKKSEYAVFAEVLQYLYNSSVKQGDEGAIVHDATAVIAYCYPQLFEYEYYKLSVLPSGETKYEKSADGIKVAMNINRPKYIETIIGLFK